MKQTSPTPPLEMLSHFSPLAPFGKDKRDFAVCGQRPKGAALWKPATFEKVDETFTVEFICATFFVMPFFLQAEPQCTKCTLRLFLFCAR